MGLSALQSAVIDFTGDLITGDLNDPDPYRGNTAIGHIGRLKQHDEIVLWLSPPPSTNSMPTLLHRATYDRYVGGSWRAQAAPLVERIADAAGTYELHSASPSAATLRLEFVVRAERAVLAVPREVLSLSIPSATRVSSNRLGVIESALAPGFHRYGVTFDPRGSGQPPHPEYDLALPRSERSTIEALVSELGLRAETPQRAIARVQAFFANEFHYSLYQPERLHHGTALGVFLTEERYGHCEYFASATVLLLRAAGIPARYATGYSVQEWSALEAAYVVRRRHAHAWAQAFVDGAWQDVDTTPSDWLEAESSAASWFAPVGDLSSWLRRRVAHWRAAGDVVPGLGLAAGILLGGLALRWGWRTRSRWKRTPGPPRNGGRANRARGRDSPFYALLQYLEASEFGRSRHRGEPLSTWLARMDPPVRSKPEGGVSSTDDTGRIDALGVDVRGLRELAHLHYRLRFSPTGLEQSELEQLTNGVGQWLAHRNENADQLSS